MPRLFLGKFSNLKEQLNEFNGFILGLKDHELPRHPYRNPFDISSKNLLDQIARMRANFLQPTLKHTQLIDDGKLYTTPIRL